MLSTSLALSSTLSCWRNIDRTTRAHCAIWSMRCVKSTFIKRRFNICVCQTKTFKKNTSISSNFMSCLTTQILFTNMKQSTIMTFHIMKQNINTCSKIITIEQTKERSFWSSFFDIIFIESMFLFWKMCRHIIKIERKQRKLIMNECSSFVQLKIYLIWKCETWKCLTQIDRIEIQQWIRIIDVSRESWQY